MSRLVIVITLSLLLVFSGCSAPSKSRNIAWTQQLYISAWFAPFDLTRGLQSFSEHVYDLQEINPVWYNLNLSYFQSGAGPFEENLLQNGPIITLARTNGVKILPTIQNWGISNFDATVISKIINNPASRSRHVDEILSLVLDNGYDGIDIDYENLPAADSEAFSLFIRELGTSLREKGRLLSVALHPKTYGQANWNGPGAQDWVVIARYADLLKIMAYDYHWSSFHAGPIAPLDWLRDILDYAATIPEAKGKIIVGLPLYGYDWGPDGTGKALTYEDTVKLMSERRILNPSRDRIKHLSSVCGYYTHNVEPHFEYQESGLGHTVFFQDVQAIRERIKVIAEYGDLIKGVALWRLGGEGPGVWDELKIDYRRFKDLL